MTRTAPGYRELAPDDPRHGTTNGYGNLGCRCERCQEAHAAEVQRAKERRAASPIPEHVHGTANGYGNYRCRCDACTEAWSIDTQHRAQRRKIDRLLPPMTPGERGVWWLTPRRSLEGLSPRDVVEQGEWLQLRGLVLSGEALAPEL